MSCKGDELIRSEEWVGFDRQTRFLHFAEEALQACSRVKGDWCSLDLPESQDLYRDSPCHALLQALEETQGKDLLFWANRYHLFVSWSPDRSHPWDSMAAANQYVTLEIGVKRGTSSQVLSIFERCRPILRAPCLG